MYGRVKGVFRLNFVYGIRIVFIEEIFLKVDDLEKKKDSRIKDRKKEKLRERCKRDKEERKGVERKEVGSIKIILWLVWIY